MTRHPFSLVHDDCQVGVGTNIWQFASVIRGAKVGDHCTVASCSVIDGAVVGSDCIVGHGSAINPGVILGDRVFVGQHVVFCNDRWPAVYKDKFDPDVVTITVEDDAVIGSGAVILPGVVIGARSVIAANSRVTKSVPRDHIWVEGTVVAIDPKTTKVRSPSAGTF